MIGTRIKEIRKKRKVTQREFSDKVCVTQSYISRVEAEKELPTEMLIKLISLEFNISLNWLKNGNGDMELTSNEYDYFEREYSSTYDKSVSKELNHLSELLSKISNSFIDLSMSGIISNIEMLLSTYESDNNFCSLLFEQLSNLIISYCDTIEKIEKEDINSPSYLNVIYGYLRQTTEDFNNILIEIGSAYEERTK